MSAFVTRKFNNLLTAAKLRETEDSLQVPYFTKGGNLPFATASSFLYIQSKPLSRIQPTWYSIEVMPYIKHDAPMTIYGQDVLVTPRARGSKRPTFRKTIKSAARLV